MEPELLVARHRARVLMHRYNASPTTLDTRERKEILAELLNALGLPLNYCRAATRRLLLLAHMLDFGEQGSHANENTYTTMLDGATVTTDTRAYTGADVYFYATTHGVSVKEHQTDLERASKKVIGDDCRTDEAHPSQSSNSSRMFVGAGSIVTKSFPDRPVVSHDSELFVELSIFEARSIRVS
ncbi:hypothetical protein IW261DRAFT_1610123 [Armillaria novae-zelandiae]|uniref:Maltose/galactoside acetyltransferase domain-containing protein n=1 Tax=Armillaria novae-zelandiae TaxID=153914 RepID=A0AA39P1J4_9AGAR|nr:hypothetical protein IW261DRAFT_1610123 [Armillaria novae-zelandiae]